MRAADPAFVNIATHLVRTAAERPRSTAMHVLASGASLTYADLDRDSDRVARGFAHLGIGRGTRVCVFVPPSRDFFAVVFALFKAGAVPVVVDPGMGIKAVGHCLAVARPEAFVGIGRAHLARVLFRWGAAHLRVKVACGGLFGWGGSTLDAVRRKGGEGSFAMPDVRPDDTAAILFTSGSTGPPKGAVYMHRTFAAQVTMLRDLYDVRPGEVDLATFPLFALLDPALGMTTVVPVMDFTRPGRTDPRHILGPVGEHAVTHMFANPALLGRIVDGAPRGTRLPSLRRVVSAGAPVRPDVLRRVQAMLTDGAQVHTPYGATEALPVCSIGGDEILGETAALTAAGAGFCVGRAVPRMDVRAIRVDDGEIGVWSDDLVLPVGEIGEVVVRGPTVTREYFDRPDATRLAKIPDGADVWHRMGDLGRFDERGRLWFCGRKAHRVDTVAARLYSVCVEALFDAHPDVRRSALVGVPTAGATRPVLCVELAAGGVLTERLENELRAIAAGHDQTREVTTFLAHPGFPVDARHNAKIRREVLAAWAQGRLV